MTRDAQHVQAYIALGSNLGDRRAHLDFAIDRLRSTARVNVEAVSRMIETAPVGPAGQGPYLNAAAKLLTSLSPRELLETCLAVERARGRDRQNAIRWGPRLLDIDLLLYSNQIIDEPGLRVPHPRMTEREFVLVPLAEFAAEVVHPVLNMTIADLLERLRTRAHREYAGQGLCSLE